MGFLVEVVVVLKAVGGGGYGCGFLGFPLVVVELGFGVAGYWCVKWVYEKRDVNGFRFMGFGFVFGLSVLEKMSCER